MSLIPAIPGEREAIAHETLVRDAAFLPVRESIAGFEVLPFRFEHYLMLRTIGSPLLSGDTPSPLQLSAFLWIVSPEYTPENGRAKKRFLKRCRLFIPPVRPDKFFFRRNERKWIARYQATMMEASKVLSAAREYVDEAFMDKPARSEGSEQVSYYSDACDICAMFAREFGWDVKTTLREPMKRILQFIKENRRYHNPKAILFNPSGKIRANWLASLPENNRRN